MGGCPVLIGCLEASLASTPLDASSSSPYPVVTSHSARCLCGGRGGQSHSPFRTTTIGLYPFGPKHPPQLSLWDSFPLPAPAPHHHFAAQTELISTFSDSFWLLKARATQNADRKCKLHAVKCFAGNWGSPLLSAQLKSRERGWAMRGLLGLQGRHSHTPLVPTVPQPLAPR